MINDFNINNISLCSTYTAKHTIKRLISILNVSHSKIFCNHAKHFNLTLAGGIKIENLLNDKRLTNFKLNNNNNKKKKQLSLIVSHAYRN